MKTFLTALILLFSLYTLTAQTAKEKTLQIKGITTDGTAYYSKRLSDVTINIYANNNLIDVYGSDNKGKFEFEISLNSYITIEFVQKDFITKRIAFNTALPELENEKEFAPFDFEIMMLGSTENLSEFETDFPVTKIEFSEESGEYIYNEKYTKHRMAEQEKILAKQN
ncbi:hypothetical protein N9242_04615 [Vicingaceae bacterium]|jgi:hypothetical protein|nr:hypothetical protein [Vicingaceae bacterium]